MKETVKKLPKTVRIRRGKGADHAKLYELKSSAEESIWVKVGKDKLVKVPAPTKGIATSKAKPKPEKTR